MRQSLSVQFISKYLVLAYFCTFPLVATAQNYYPTEIGNEWILQRTDGKEQQKYTLEVPEDNADRDLILLKIETKNLNNDKVVDTDKYYLSDTPDSIKLHKTILEQAVGAVVATASANLSNSEIFFPKVMKLGDKWEIVVDADLTLQGVPPISLKTTTVFTIVDFEDVVTPVGTFQNCAKIELKFSATGLITLNPTTTYQWLAPEVGPVKYQNADGLEYEIISFKRSPPPGIDAQNRPVWQLPTQNYQVTGSRLGSILNAKILVNVEDYVTEVENLGILSVTGDILQPGDGTGLATNQNGKQDLWVAGRFVNAPIIGTITLYAENNRGRRTVRITVRINANQ